MLHLLRNAEVYAPEPLVWLGAGLPAAPAESRRRAPACPRHRKLRCRRLLASGQPLERVLPAFTSNVSRLLLQPLKVQIATGAGADLVVLHADGAVSDAMARGRWHVRGGRSVVRGTFERAERA